MADDYTQMRIRLPTALHEAVQAASKRNEHSLNSEIVDRLSSTFIRDRQSADITNIFTVLAGPQNAKLMQMVAAALHLTTRDAPANSENMEAFACAVDYIARACAGAPAGEMGIDEYMKLDEIAQSGIAVAAIVLMTHDLSPPLSKQWLHKVMQAVLEQEDQGVPGLRLADLGRIMPVPTRAATLADLAPRKEE